MVQNNVPRPRRGRPPLYDARQAITAARDAFWRAGYQATSLDDLSAVTGMNRPSLYNAFGDKRAIFLRALAEYRAVNVATVRQVLSEAATLRAGLRDIYKRAIDIYVGGPTRGRGCFVLNSAPSEAEMDDDVRAELGSITHEIDAAFAVRMTRAQAEGELGANVEIAQRARLAMGVIHSLSMRARSGETRAELEALAESAAELVSA